MSQVRAAAAVDVLDGRTVQVRALTYGVPDSYGTSWRPGCATRALQQGRMPLALWSHDRSRVVGKVTGYADGPAGLVLTLRLADPADVPDVRMVQALLRDDILDGVSIGFADGVTQPDPLHRGVRQFTEVRIVEISFVAVPSVPGARVLAVRGAGTAVRPVTQTAWALALLTLQSVRAGGTGMGDFKRLRLVRAQAQRNEAQRRKASTQAEARNRQWATSWEAAQWEELVRKGETITAPAPPRPTFIPGMTPPEDVDPWGELAGQTFAASPPPVREPPQDLINAAVAELHISPAEAIKRWYAAQSR